MLAAQEELPQCPAFQTPSQVFRLTPAAPSPFSQGDPGQFDEVSHAGAQEDGLLVTVPSPIVTLYLLHHELGMPQERILCESIQFEHTRRNCGLLEKNKTEVSLRLKQNWFTSNMLLICITCKWDFPRGSVVKNPPASILSQEISWTEKPGGLQAMGSPRVGPKSVNEQHHM